MKIAQPRHESDCVAAALATILELPIEELPDFWHDEKGKRRGGLRQHEAVREWLADRGYHYYYSSMQPVQFAEFQTRKFEKGNSWPSRGYWLGRIARVEWLMEDEIVGHMVVMKGHKCVHNPSDEMKPAAALKAAKANDVFLIGYYHLLPLDPARLVIQD